MKRIRKKLNQLRAPIHHWKGCDCYFHSYIAEFAELTHLAMTCQGEGCTVCLERGYRAAVDSDWDGTSELDFLRRVGDTRVLLETKDMGILINTTFKGVYLIAKYGHGGILQEPLHEFTGTLTYRCGND